MARRTIGVLVTDAAIYENKGQTHDPGCPQV
jgi:hypothetical protein